MEQTKNHKHIKKAYEESFNAQIYEKSQLYYTYRKIVERAIELAMKTELHLTRNEVLINNEHLETYRPSKSTRTKSS